MAQRINIQQGTKPGTNNEVGGLRFDSDAACQDNILGYPSFNKVVYYNDFLGPAADETNEISVNESHGGTGAINVAKSGTYRLTTSTTDDDKCEVSGEKVWYASCACVMEARIKVDAITTVKINVGWSDAKSEADNLTAMAISGTSASATADDCAVFVFDTDGDSDYWYYANAIATSAAATSTAIAPVAATYEVFRVALDTSGNASYYRNGLLVGYKASAITTTDALAWYVAVQSLAGTAARNLDIDYIKCWQNRA